MDEECTTERSVVITGGAGFLGLSLAHHLAATAPARPLVLVDTAPFTPRDYPQGATLVQGDVRDVTLLDRLMQKHRPAAVVHAAAPRPTSGSEELVDINQRGTLAVLTASERAEVERVVYISTTALYGTQAPQPCPEDAAAGRCESASAEARSKHEAEAICESFRARGQVVTILRPRPCLGPGRLGVLGILFDWVADGKRLPLIGDGDNRFQLLEVTDFCDAARLSLSLPARTVNATFNLGATRFATLYDDIDTLCAYAGTGARPVRTPARAIKAALGAFARIGISPVYDGIYASADRDVIVDVSRAREVLGWQPRYANSDALIRSYQWYIDHRDELPSLGGTRRRTGGQGVLRVVRAFM